jgi:glycine cleavage system H protein
MADIAPKNGEFNEGKLWFHRNVESIDFPAEGDDFEKGDVVATVDGTNGKFEVIAPASGIVQEINEAAKEEPDVVADDPLEEGWLVKLEVQDTTELKEFA